MEETVPLQEVAWSSVLQTGGFMYLILSLSLAIIMIISTSVTCSKQHFGASFQLGLILTVVPVIIYALSSKYTFIRKPFANVIEMMGITPERSMLFGGAYILLLFLLPLTVYGIHSAEESACVATADEMSSFKTKMLKELQEKQEAEEKNALKK
jgi:hypothetical protein